MIHCTAPRHLSTFNSRIVVGGASLHIANTDRINDVRTSPVRIELTLRLRISVCYCAAIESIDRNPRTFLRVHPVNYPPEARYDVRE